VTQPDEVWESDRSVRQLCEGQLRMQHRSDLVAVLEFSRPPYNFFDEQLVGGIADAAHAAADEGARAIVLCSAGRSFCAGADFGETEVDDLDPGPLYREAVRLFRQPLPMVAAIQGAAVGGGVGLALAADFRIASQAARFAVNFTSLGIHPGFGLSVTLPRTVGVQAAADLMLTGRRIDGVRAAEIGLVDAVVPAGEDRTAALHLAQEIAQAAPLAVRSVRTTLRGDIADQVAAAVEHERSEQLQLFRTADFQEGLSAVRERRPGKFGAR
jgi:2-(1,2-epoxy-1,2-dihydrophenyl)acetyl-CoA isomerase